MKITKKFSGVYAVEFQNAVATVEIDESERWSFCITFRDGNKVRNQTKFTSKRIALEKIQEIVG
jgi:hypothetical protein